MILFVGLLILMPVYTTEGWSATKVACLSNMKQISLAAQMYVADADEMLPPYYTFDEQGRRFVDVLLPYVKQREIFLCPKNPKHPDQPRSMEEIPNVLSYVHFGSLRSYHKSDSKGSRTLALSTNSGIIDPARVHYLRDPIVGFDTDGSSNSDLQHIFLSPHGRTFATGFLDGHAKHLVLGQGEDF